MENFQQLLARYAQAAPKLGTAHSFPLEALRTDLREVVRRNSAYFLTIFIALTILLLLAVLVLARFFDQPAKAAAVLAASGVSIPFILRTMVRMWESKVKSEALLVLSASVDEKVMRTVVVALAQQGKPDPARSKSAGA